MGTVVNWQKYRSKMTNKEKKAEDFGLWVRCLIDEANDGEQWAIDLLKETKAKLVIATQLKKRKGGD